MEILLIIFGILIGLIGSWLYYKTLSDRSHQEFLGSQKVLEARNSILENELKKFQSDLINERNKSNNLTIGLSKAQTTIEYLNEKLLYQKGEMDELQQRFSKEFEFLASRILEEKSDKFTRLNKSSLEEIIKPLSEKIKDFEKKIEDNTKESIERHTSLKEQIFHLNQLNQQISREANNLASALKGQVQVQGKWGEIILERILEKSGLTKDREYFVQAALNQSRPDIIIHLPAEKKLIIDSKVSLTAYDRFCAEEEDALKAKYLKEHMSSLRSHIKNLSEKNYQNLFAQGSLDFILLFIPIEPAFNLAVINDGELFNEAFDKNIVIVSTSTLLATLRTIASIWKHENQNKNVLEIARQSGELYDKFVGFVNDMDEIGKKLGGVQNCYDSAINKLKTGKGNLIGRAETIKKLGAKTTKVLPDHLIEGNSENN